MTEIKQAPVIMVKMSELRPWEQNPKRITKEGLDNLEAKIRKHGLYKPLIIQPDNLIIGGNQRYQVLLRMGVEEVQCSVVQPKDEAEMIEIAIGDNENDGEWVAEQLVELVHDKPVELGLFNVHLGNMPLATLVEGPPDVPKPKKEQVSFQANKELVCPECGHRNTRDAFKPLEDEE